MLSASGGCEIAVTIRVKTAWKKFRELLPVLTSRHLSYKTRGHVYSSCLRSALHHASETWPLTKTNLQRLQRNDRAMIRQICSIKPEDVATVRSNELLAKLELENLDLILRERRLPWFGHERSSGAIRTACDIQIDGRRGAGRSGLAWDLLCVQLASYLERGPLMWMMPLHLHANQKSDYDDMTSPAGLVGGKSYSPLWHYQPQLRTDHTSHVLVSIAKFDKTFTLFHCFCTCLKFTYVF